MALPSPATKYGLLELDFHARSDANAMAATQLKRLDLTACLIGQGRHVHADKVQKHIVRALVVVRLEQCFRAGGCDCGITMRTPMRVDRAHDTHVLSNGEAHCDIGVGQCEEAVGLAQARCHCGALHLGLAPGVLGVYDGVAQDRGADLVVHAEAQEIVDAMGAVVGGPLRVWLRQVQCGPELGRGLHGGQ